MKDLPKRPSEKEIAEWMKETIEPICWSRTYPACAVYFYTDLEHDDIPPTFHEEDKQYFCKILKDRLSPHPC